MSSFLNKGASKSSAPKKPGKTFSGNKTWFVFAIVSAIAAAGLIFAILSNIVSTTTYYVLKQDVPARSQVTPDMLQEVVASTGSQPPNAMGLEEVTYSEVYAKFALNTGDIITASNTGELIPLQKGIPEGYVVASFTADANNAVAGKLATGNYIDIIAVGENSGASAVAKYALRHVLVMDVSSDPSAIGETTEDTTTTDPAAATTDATAPKSTQDQLRAGIPSLYTVALPPADAAKLALIRDKQILVVLSPASSDKNFKDESISATDGQVFSDTAVGDSGKDTDPTFGQGKEEKAADTATPTPAATTPAPSASPSETASETPSEEPAAPSETENNG